MDFFYPGTARCVVRIVAQRKASAVVDGVVNLLIAATHLKCCKFTVNIYWFFGLEIFLLAAYQLIILIGDLLSVYAHYCMSRSH